MATYHSVKADIMTLNDFNKQSLFNFLAEILSASPLSMMECRESRFSKGQVCPHCEGTHVIKYGMIGLSTLN